MPFVSRPPSLAAWCEQPLLLQCEGESLLALLCSPAQTSCAQVGAVIIVGGPQYRAGSHRQFVQLARAMAASGTPTLRFDARGMGDSTGERRPFTDMAADIAAGIQGLRDACPSVTRVVLCGLCDGASAIVLQLEQPGHADLAGLILMNPWLRTGAAASSATLVRHYYLRRLLDRAFWSRLLRGALAPGSLREFFGHAVRSARPGPAVAALGDEAASAYPERMARALSAHPLPVLLVLSGADLTAREFVAHTNSDPAWKKCLRRPRMQRLNLPQADHTFSGAADRHALEAACVDFVASVLRPAGRGHCSAR